MASATQLHVGYQSAIVIAPELSRLRVLVNGTVVIDQPIESAETIADVTAGVAPGVLRAGQNVITFETVARHRTDCSIQSTYELWTEIEPDRTYLSFGREQVMRFMRPEDVAAIGVDDKGASQFNIVAPSLDVVASTTAVLRLSEALAIYANMPNQTINVTSSPVGPAGNGQMNVVIGLPGDLDDVLAQVPQGATVSPTISFVNDAKTGPGTMVVSGPSWQAINSAVETLISPIDRPADALRQTLSTQSYRYPDAPIFFDAARVEFSKLGVSTQEFSGRRFRTDFAVGVPTDFYANAYGEARLLLDAAYSPEVMPGSHIDVYVNGNVAATVPITNSGGSILRQLPVPVTMRHFRPGANTVTVEAVLLTRADAACAPGTTGNTSARFVVFDSSAFEMPRFARIAQLPNLAGTAGTGFPYNRAVAPVPVVIDTAGTDSISTAATFLARMSVAGSRPIPVEPVATLAAVGDRDALFFGPVSKFQPDVLAQLGLTPETRTAWGTEAIVADPVDPQQTTATFDRWRQELSGSGWRGQVSSFQDWLERNFDITADSLRLTPAEAAQFTPPEDASLVMSQRPGPDNKSIWTMVTAPTPQALREGGAALMQTSQWQKVGGDTTTFDQNAQDTQARPVTASIYRETQPFSLVNMRLIASNWLSANILSFASALFVACMLLGVATATLLRSLGRSS